MPSDLSRRVDDLTLTEAARVLHAYEAGLLHEDHEEALARAMEMFRAFRPELPLSVVAAELEILLAFPPQIDAQTGALRAA